MRRTSKDSTETTATLEFSSTSITSFQIPIQKGSLEPWTKCSISTVLTESRTNSSISTNGTPGSTNEALGDTGTPDSHLDAAAWHVDGPNAIHPNASIENTTLGANVLIIAGARIEDAPVENSVTVPDATISGGEIRRSIVDEDTHVEDLDLAGAMIGTHTR